MFDDILTTICYYSIKLNSSLDDDEQNILFVKFSKYVSDFVNQLISDITDNVTNIKSKEEVANYISESTYSMLMSTTGIR